jgi:hypothetical protein
LVGKEGEYLGPRDAVREVCRDLLFHQDAFLDAMNNAFVEFADRFEPDELADSFDRTLSSNPLVRWRNKSKYWRLYCDLYPILTEKGGGRFPQMYAEEFVKAYERQIADYKRMGGGDNHLKETVVLNKSKLKTDDVEELLDESEIEPVAEEDDFRETVTFEDVSLDDLPDDGPADQAKG